jgi:hypothetical protein
VSDAMKVASYAMVPIGVTGVAMGIYEALTGYPLPGALVAVFGVAAASLAVVKLRRSLTS